MSTVPQRQPETRTDSQLAQALTEQAKAHASVRLADQRIAELRDGNASRLNYTWDTPDDRQAEFTIYFSASEEVKLLASQLVTLDDEPPTAQQRVQLEQLFEAELDAFGEVYSDVASHAWERVGR